MTYTTLRAATRDGVREIVLTRAAEYNTITPALRDELAAAIDEADADRDVRVILLRAEGRAFCAGYGLDWSTQAQAREGARAERVWDSVADHQMMSRFVDVVHEALVRAEADDRRGAGLVHRRRHGHGALRRPRRRRRGARASATRPRASGARRPPRCGSTGWASRRRSATCSPATRSRRGRPPRSG